MSKYVIYTAQTEAVNREQKVTDDVMFSDGYTTRYCDIIKHINEDLWAVVIDKFYTQYFTQQEIDNSIELDSSWFNPPINI